MCFSIEIAGSRMAKIGDKLSVINGAHGGALFREQDKKSFLETILPPGTVLDLNGMGPVTVIGPSADDGYDFIRETGMVRSTSDFLYLAGEVLSVPGAELPGEITRCRGCPPELVLEPA